MLQRWKVDELWNRVHGLRHEIWKLCQRVNFYGDSLCMGFWLNLVNVPFYQQIDYFSQGADIMRSFSTYAI